MKKKIDEDDVDEEPLSREAIKQMAKRIKLLEAKIRHMSEAQLKMQKYMEALINKIVKRASMYLIKATKKLTKSNDVLQHATSTTQKAAIDSVKLEGVINF